MPPDIAAKAPNLAWLPDTMELRIVNCIGAVALILKVAPVDAAQFESKTESAMENAPDVVSAMTPPSPVRPAPKSYATKLLENTQSKMETAKAGNTALALAPSAKTPPLTCAVFPSNIHLEIFSDGVPRRPDFVCDGSIASAPP